MGRICLTDAQRAAARYKDRANRLADDLAVYKRRHKLTNLQIAKATGLGHMTVARLLDADVTVRLSLETYWKLEEMAKAKDEG